MIENSIKKAPHLVVELLESFSDKELKGLQKIASCAYFNTDRYVVKLLEVLIKRVLHKTGFNQIIQYRLYNLVFSDLPAVKNELNQKQKVILRSKISSLTRLAERFITIEALEQSKMHQYDLKLNALLGKKQYRLFNKHLKKGEAIAGTKLEQMEDFELKHKLEDCKLLYLHQTGQWLKEDNINKLISIVDLNYLISRMSYTRTALAFQARKPKTSYNLSLAELAKSPFFSKYLNNDYPYLSLTMTSLQLRLEQTYKVYFQFIKLLEKNESFISPEELKNYYMTAANFCARMIKKGFVEYSNHYINLIKLLDKKKLLTLKNSISIMELKNLIVISCNAGEFSWVQQMIKKYTPYINQKYRMDVEKFNLGYVAFQKGNYEKAIDHFLEVNNFQKSYDIDKRMFILKAYYELEKYYTEPTAQLFRSIEAFVMNNKQYTELDKKVYKNTIRIFYNLYRYKHKVGKMTLDTLQEKVEQAEYIASKAWLLEKIEELRK